MFSPPFTFYAAAAIYLSTFFLIHILSSNFRVPYLHSEWLCWLFLLLATKLVTPSNDDDQDATTQSDKLALAIAAVCAFRTIGGVDWALVCLCVPKIACAPTDPPVLIATTHALVAAHHTPSVENEEPSTRIGREGSAGQNRFLSWTRIFDISPSLCSASCVTVCSLASTATIFSMADLRRSYFRPHPNGRLHVDARTERRTLVRAGRGPDTSTFSCNIMAGFSCTDHDVADHAQNLPANKVLGAGHLGRRCDAEVSTMGDGHGIGQSPPFCSVAFSESRVGAQRIFDAPDYDINVCYQHHKNIPFASYNGESWICC